MMETTKVRSRNEDEARNLSQSGLWNNKKDKTIICDSSPPSSTTTTTNHNNQNYDDVVAWCRHHIHSGSDFLFQPEQVFQETLQDAATKFDFPIPSLHSLFRNLHVQYVKTNSSVHVRRHFPSMYLPQYLQNPTTTTSPSQSSSSSSSILQLAKRANYPPYLFCRILVEQITNLSSLSVSSSSSSSSSSAVLSSSCTPAVATYSAGTTKTMTTTTTTTANNTSTTAKKNLTLAMRDPMGMLGDLRVIRPEYRSSEPGVSCHAASTSTTSNNIEGVTTTTPCMTPPQQSLANQARNDSPTTVTSLDDGTTNIMTKTTTTTRLAQEVQEAISSDPMYGPKHDKERHWIGVEYEVLLEQTLMEMEIPFETETQLRERGSSRTPDVLLTCPIGVQLPTTGEWKVVCWIDSKALFGDVDTHATSVLPQAESYVHRFGPGMVLYWFGHAPLTRLGDAKGDIVIWGWDLPETFLWPTGEVGRRRQKQKEDISKPDNIATIPIATTCGSKSDLSNIDSELNRSGHTETPPQPH